MSNLTEDGYPTDEALDALTTWPIDSREDIIELLEFARSIWRWPDYATRDGDTFTFVTGGWSGHEDIIQALDDHPTLNPLAWQSSERGGRHVYRP